jgi:hypothetical protein
VPNVVLVCGFVARLRQPPFHSVLPGTAGFIA